MACKGQFWLRYEDVAQDGRVLLEPMCTSLGVVWREELADHPLYPWCRDQGIIPITTRIVVDGTEGPFPVERAVDVEGSWDVTRSENPERLLLNIRTKLYAPIGRTNLPPPDDAGTRAVVGSVLAEHVFTRPFAEPNERRVTDIGDFGRGAARVEWAEPKALWLQIDASTYIDLATIAFGPTHTDSNQHVNSLVYPRLFEEAVLRRLAELGRPTQVLMRGLDVRYRKPSFMGDRLSLALRLFEREGRVAAAGAFFEPGTAPESGRVFLQATFS
jgi:hypothetical protein